MKKLILILLLSSGLIGCSAIDYSELSSPVSPSDTQIERIISLGLSHSDSLLEANKLIAVTPGIRPVANDDDQKRVVDVATAFKSGSDYIVVGRPIKNAENRYQAASNIQKIIKSTFEAV